MAVVRRASVAVYGLATGDEKHLFDFGASGLAYASDGSELCSSDSGGLFRYSTETWRPAKDRVAHRQHSAPQEFAFSPTGNFVAVRDVRAVHLWDLKRLRMSRTLVSPLGDASYFHGLAIPDHGKIVASSDEQDLLSWDLPDDAFASEMEPRLMTGKKLIPDARLNELGLCHRIGIEHGGNLKKTCGSVGRAVLFL